MIILVVVLVLTMMGSGSLIIFTPIAKAEQPIPVPTATAVQTSTGNFLSYDMEIADNATVYESVIGDVNGDGFNDIIGAVEHVGLSYYLYPNWEKHTISSFDYGGDVIACGDIDNDKSLDVVGVENSTNIYWFDNSNSNANWTRYFIGSTGSTLNSTSIIRSMKVVDFNNDGKLDVVIRTPTTTRIYLQITPLSWNLIKIIPHIYINSLTNSINMDGLDVGDIDRDGDLDIVENGFWIETPSDLLDGYWVQHSIDSKWYNQTWGFNQSSGGWESNNAKVCVADINNDGYLDVVFSQPERAGFSVSWYELSDLENDSWVEHVIGFVDFCHTLGVGDMNGDGYLDVVAGEMETQDGLNPGPYPLYVFFNDGNGSWIKQEISDVGIYSGSIGDIGNDGILDVVGCRSYWEGPLEIWRGYYSSDLVPTSTPTPSPSSDPDPTSTPTLAPSPTPDPTSEPTSTPSPTPTPTPNLTPTSASTPSPKTLPKPTPNPTHTSIVTQISTPTPTSTHLVPPASSFSPKSSPNSVHSEFTSLVILPLVLVALTPAILIILRKRNRKN